MEIVDLQPDDSFVIQQIAQLLVEAFRKNWPEAWPDMTAALETVQESFGPDRLSRVALDERGMVLGWIGGIRQYDGHVWELHPLVVRPDRQGQGIGRALVADLETRVRERGGLTLWVGTDDENNMTSLGGANLYPNVLEHLAPTVPVNRIFLWPGQYDRGRWTTTDPLPSLPLIGGGLGWARLGYKFVLPSRFPLPSP
jgi:aminoglycoside 6'-N-acetyltransferase I